ncbi:hypothetical protein HJG60_010043 [Phyllostomus discolor]|uniref:Uncharacterized protein n=1 Tax=Phyllostomus discolor TaxID=89673 RepID=A0A834EMF4_9CHIR|nr:hypothetical protein HJG60_010043 [Phyllostomus discolor]
MGLALGRVGTPVWSTPSSLFAGLCGVAAGRPRGICIDGPRTRWGCGLPQPQPPPVACLSFPCTRQRPKGRNVHSASLSVCLSSPRPCPPGAFSFQGCLQPPSLRCVRAWGLRSFCLAQIHILFSSLCNNPCSWWSRGELRPEGEAEAASSGKPLAWLCRCDYRTPSRCTVSTV